MFSHMLVSLISIVLVAAFTASYIFSSARATLERTLEDQTFATGNALEALQYPLEELSQDNLEPVKEVLDQLLEEYPEVEYTLYDPGGIPLLNRSGILPAMANPTTAPEVIEAFEGDFGKGTNIRPDETGRMMVYKAILIQRGNEIPAILRLDTPIESAMVSARRSIATLVLVSLLVMLGVSLFGLLLANNLSKPIQLLTESAERIAQGDLSVRVKPSGPQEMKRLALAFNSMAGRLQTHVDELRAFVANASHELRTPLTVVKLRAEALVDGALDDHAVAEQFMTEINNEVDRLGKMVNDLLDLSRIEAGLSSNQRVELNLEAIATDVYEAFLIRANKTNVQLELDIEPGLGIVCGNEDQIRRVLFNLVENAIKYNQENGKVELLARSGVGGKTVRVLVRDSGPGIGAEHQSHLFERFYRVESTRQRNSTPRGSGLGLAIAKSIIENHGGKIGVSSQPGVGTTFWFELPILETA